jgi:surface protein
MFENCFEFNDDISNWVWPAISADYMFSGCDEFNNGDAAGQSTKPLNNLLNTPNWSSAIYMFQGCSSFNQDISGWNFVTGYEEISLEGIFQNAINFNRPLSWNTIKVANMSFMFDGANSFNQDISSWNTSNVTTMESMFASTNSFNQELPWNTVKVTNMNNMFNGALIFNQPGIGQWDIDALVPLGMNGMLDNSGITNSNYNLILTGFDSGVIPTGITLGANNCQATSSAAITARNNLINNHGWTINDIPPPP